MIQSARRPVQGRRRAVPRPRPRAARSSWFRTDVLDQSGPAEHDAPSTTPGRRRCRGGGRGSGGGRVRSRRSRAGRWTGRACGRDRAAVVPLDRRWIQGRSTHRGGRPGRVRGIPDAGAVGEGGAAAARQCPRRLSHDKPIDPRSTQQQEAERWSASASRRRAWSRRARNAPRSSRRLPRPSTARRASSNPQAALVRVSGVDRAALLLTGNVGDLRKIAASGVKSGGARGVVPRQRAGASATSAPSTGTVPELAPLGERRSSIR